MRVAPGRRARALFRSNSIRSRGRHVHLAADGLRRRRRGLRQDATRALDAIRRRARVIQKDGALWVAWPKKASGVHSEIGEADVRAFGLDRGLVDVKVCAIDETWSGLKFVIRLADR